MLSGRLKSKRGISLPVAMAITSVLAILSASLIAIALSSISSTSRIVNSRQAYLNARSAIQYATAYYNDSAIEPDQIETQQEMELRGIGDQLSFFSDEQRIEEFYHEQNRKIGYRPDSGQDGVA